MEVKAGYKQTEVGIIPEDWDASSLGDIGDVIRGASPRPKGDKRFYGGDVPRLMVEDITRDKHWVTPSIDFLTDEGAKLSRLCKRGTLTVVCSGTPTAVGLPALLAVDACIHDGIMALVRTNKDVSSEFLFHQLGSLQKKLHAAATHGGTFVNLTTDGFRAFKVALPPTKAEQEAIAETLSDVDALIEALEQLIAKKRQVKQGVMQELLTGKRRLPGFGDEWKTKTIGEIGNKFLNGGTPSTKKVEYWEGTIPWITGADIIDQRVVDVVRRFITDEAVKNSSTNLVEKGNLLVVTRTGVGKIAIAPFDLAISQDLTGVYVKREYVLPEFLYWYFSYNTGSLRNLNQGTSIAGITRDTLMSLSISLPSIPEQTAIAETLSDMDAEIAALEAKLAKARQVKQGMMSVLLTGRIRLI